MNLLPDLVSALLLLAGAFCVAVGGLGVVRMPDFYTRIHAAGITDTLGSGLILAGLMVQGGFSHATVKLALILGFLLFTSPVSSHALAKAALSDDIKPLLEDGPPSPP